MTPEQQSYFAVSEKQINFWCANFQDCLSRKPATHYEKSSYTKTEYISFYESIKKHTFLSRPPMDPLKK